MPLKTPADVPQTDPPLSPRYTLPTMYDLPSEDPEEPGLPDVFHYFQPHLLQETFRPPAYPPERIFAAGDLNLYYDVHHPLWHKRPDWFAVLGVPALYEECDLRLSYVVWQEGVMPYIVVELLSPGTEKEDLGKLLREAKEPPGKWEVYERILRIPYYIVYDRYTTTLRAFALSASSYQELALPEQRLWLPEVQLGLGLWSGVYQDIAHEWLRWYDAENNWIPTAAERMEQERKRAERGKLQTEKERQRAEQEKQRAEQEKQRAEKERQRAEQEKQRAEQEKQRAEKLAARLRSLGIEPDEL